MDDKILVSSCDFCKIFLNKEVTTRLYWPETVEDIPKEEFVIVDCKDCKTPILVISEHLTDITREQWGRILYRCRKIFGSGVTLKKHNLKIRDHLSYHIYNIK